MSLMHVRDVSLFVKVAGQGDPLLLMHGGPGLDHTTLLPLLSLAERYTLVFYDHRCNGRSMGADVSSMTWDNLVADAEALRQALGFERWAVVGHSFGGHVALEYALRHPERISHLILMDTSADTWWSRENAAQLLAKRGYSHGAVEAVQRFFHGDYAPEEFFSLFMKFGKAYFYRFNLKANMSAGDAMEFRPDAHIFAGSRLLDGWSVMDRLWEIETPALVVAGRQDFLFPPECVAILADRLPDARLAIIERAGHNPQAERPAETLAAIESFLAEAMPVMA